MAHYRLLDADFLINLIRTLSLIKKHDNSIDNKIEQICNESHYSFVSTKIVENEVNEITKMLHPSGRDLFFESMKNDASKIKKEIFGAVRFIDIRKNSSMNIYKATGQKNLGEISLAVLLSSRYAEFINSSGNSVKIVSNNTNDVIDYLNDMKKINAKLSPYEASSMTMQNYEFYYDMFDHLGFDKSFRYYYYFVSNIDARIYNKNKIRKMLYNETGYS